MRVSGVVHDSIVDGPGVRLTIFFQGCTHACEGCHNPQTHALDGGYEMAVADVLTEIDGNSLLDGVTFSGGEPFLQALELLPLAREIQERRLHLVIYSGYVYEEVYTHPDFSKLLAYADWLVDGRFINSQKTLDFPFRGSKNQRIIDVKRSLSESRVVLVDF